MKKLCEYEEFLVELRWFFGRLKCFLSDVRCARQLLMKLMFKIKKIVVQNEEF